MRKLTLEDLQHLPELVDDIQAYTQGAEPEVVISAEGYAGDVYALSVGVAKIEVEFTHSDYHNDIDYVVKTGYLGTQDLVASGVDSEIIAKSYEWLRRTLDNE